MSHNPCHHPCDWTDGDEPTTDDLGCCSPYPIRKTCEAPEVRVPDCDEQDPVVSYDPETEEFTILTNLYDQNCSPITDQNSSIIQTLIT